jgi:hypothetical protein
MIGAIKKSIVLILVMLHHHGIEAKKSKMKKGPLSEGDTWEIREKLDERLEMEDRSRERLKRDLKPGNLTAPPPQTNFTVGTAEIESGNNFGKITVRCPIQSGKKVFPGLATVFWDKAGLQCDHGQEYVCLQLIRCGQGADHKAADWSFCFVELKNQEQNLAYWMTGICSSKHTVRAFDAVITDGDRTMTRHREREASLKTLWFRFSSILGKNWIVIAGMILLATTRQRMLRMALAVGIVSWMVGLKMNVDASRSSCETYIHGTTLNEETTTWFTVESEECQTLSIQSSHGVMVIGLTRLESKEGWKFSKLVPKELKAEQTSSWGCPGGMEPSAEGSVCRDGTFQTGWGDGCLTFGQGKIRQCVTLKDMSSNARDYIWEFLEPAHIWTAEISLWTMETLSETHQGWTGKQAVPVHCRWNSTHWVNGDSICKTMPGARTTLKLGQPVVTNLQNSFATVEVDCHLVSQEEMRMSRLVVYFEDGEWHGYKTNSDISDMMGMPYTTRMSGEVFNQERAIEWGETKRNAIDFAVKGIHGRITNKLINYPRQEIEIRAEDKLEVLRSFGHGRAFCGARIRSMSPVTEASCEEGRIRSLGKTTGVVRSETSCVGNIISDECMIPHPWINMARGKHEFQFFCPLGYGKICIANKCFVHGVRTAWDTYGAEPIQNMANAYHHYRTMLEKASTTGVIDGLKKGFVKASEIFMNILGIETFVQKIVLGLVGAILMIYGRGTVRVVGIVMLCLSMMTYVAATEVKYDPNSDSNDHMDEDTPKNLKPDMIDFKSLEKEHLHPDEVGKKGRTLIGGGVERTDRGYSLKVGVVENYNWLTHYGMRINPARAYWDAREEYVTDYERCRIGLTTIVAVVKKSDSVRIPKILEAMEHGSTARPDMDSYTFKGFEKDQTSGKAVYVWDNNHVPTITARVEDGICHLKMQNKTEDSSWTVDMERIEKEKKRRNDVDRWARERKVKVVEYLALDEIILDGSEKWGLIRYSETIAGGENFKLLKPIPVNNKLGVAFCEGTPFDGYRDEHTKEVYKLVFLMYVISMIWKDTTTLVIVWYLFDKRGQSRTSAVILMLLVGINPLSIIVMSIVAIFMLLSTQTVECFVDDLSSRIYTTHDKIMDRVRKMVHGETQTGMHNSWLAGILSGTTFPCWTMLLLIIFIARRRVVVPTGYFVTSRYVGGKHGDRISSFVEGDRKPRHGEVCEILWDTMFGPRFHIGWGTWWKESLFTSYHVAPSSSVWVAGTEFKASHVDAEGDRVIFGNAVYHLPHLSEGDYVRQIRVRKTWLWRYEAKAYDLEVNETDGMTAHIVMPKTKPGDSGLPIILMTGSGPTLAGSSGHWMTHDGMGDKQIELVKFGKTRDMRAEVAGVNVVGMHCGAGKTRTHIPRIILNGDDNDRFIVATPTRTVAREAYEALKETFPEQVSLEISGTGAPVRGAKIKIMAHETALRRALKFGWDQRVIYIVDEYHFPQPATVALTLLLERRVLEGKQKAWFLSATTLPELYKETNFVVDDHPIRVTDIPQIISQANVKKILWIVPGGVENVKKRLGRTEYDVVLLSSKHMENFEKAKRMTTGLIIATNIIECGANLGVDVVVDERLERSPRYDYNTGEVTLVSREITQASAVQRRGRVGRQFPGSYYYVANEESEHRFFHPDDALWLDVMVWTQGNMGGQSVIYGNIENIIDTPAMMYMKRLAEKGYFMRAMSSDIPISLAIRMIADWGRDPTPAHYISYNELGSRDSECDKCPMKIRHQDERMHDITISRRVIEGYHSMDYPSMESLLEEDDDDGWVQDSLKRILPNLNEGFGSRNLEIPITYLTMYSVGFIVLAFALMSMGSNKVSSFVSRSLKLLLHTSGVIAWGYVMLVYIDSSTLTWMQVLSSSIIGFIVMRAWIGGILETHYHSTEAGVFASLLMLAYIGEVRTFEVPNIREVITDVRHWTTRSADTWDELGPNISPTIVAAAMFATIDIEWDKEAASLLYSLAKRNVNEWNFHQAGSTQAWIAAIGVLASLIQAGPTHMIVPATSAAIGILVGIAYVKSGITTAAMKHMETTTSNSPPAEYMTSRKIEGKEPITVAVVSSAGLSIVMFWCGYIDWMTIALGSLHPIMARMGMLPAGLTETRVALLVSALIERLPTMICAALALVYLEGSFEMESKTGGGMRSGRHSIFGFRGSKLEALWREWKERLNKMDQNRFRRYRMINVIKLVKGHGVLSKGYYKLQELAVQTRPHGRVLELGGGIGGMTQYLAATPEVTGIVTYQIEARKHAKPMGIQEKVAGFEKIDERSGNIFNLDWGVILKQERFDTLICDIGEAKAGFDQQEQYSFKLRNTLDRIIDMGKFDTIIVKELAPWSVNAAEFRKKHGLGLSVSRYAKNSTSEIYLTSGGSSDDLLYNRVRELIARMHVQDPHLITVQGGDAPVVFVNQEPGAERPWILDPPDYSKTMDKIREKWTLRSPRNEYKSVKEVAIVQDVGDVASGVSRNRIMEKLLSGLDKVGKFTKMWSLTDTRAVETFSMYKKKVDQPVVENHTHRRLLRGIWVELAQRVHGKMGSTGMLSIEEAVERLNKSKVENWEKIHITQDLKNTVETEMDSIIRGEPTLGLVNTMGKKEKKLKSSGERKGSRLISFYDIPVRIVEQMIFGGILDNLTRRSVLPTGVGYMNPVDYFNLMADESLAQGEDVHLERTGFLAEDVAGWDTKVSKQDLEAEAWFLKQLGSGDRHKKAIHGMYRMYANHLVGVKRPRGNTVDLSIVEERKGRMSGTIVTYSMNTVLNTVLNVGHIVVTEGVSINTALDMIADGTYRMYISGDDKVIGGHPDRIQRLADNPAYWGEIGYIRKNMTLTENSNVIRDFYKLEFCSHSPEWVTFRTNLGEFKKWCSTRNEDEILAKSIYSVGGFVNMETQMGHALELRNTLLMYVFRRDIRRLCEAITRAAPPGMVPQGKTRKPREMMMPWMSQSDIDACCKSIFSDSSLYPIPGMEGVDDVCYVSQVRDMMTGSYIHQPGRTAWKLSLGKKVQDIRKMMTGWTYDSLEPVEKAIAKAGLDPYNTVVETRENLKGVMTANPDDDEVRTEREGVNVIRYKMEFRDYHQGELRKGWGVLGYPSWYVAMG